MQIDDKAVRVLKEFSVSNAQTILSMSIDPKAERLESVEEDPDAALPTGHCR
jgi:hypothetical protein